VLKYGAVKLNYLETGEGQLVIMLHGFPDTPRTFDALIPKIAARGYRVVAPFLRGYAPSEAAPDGDYAALKLGQDVLDLMDTLGVKRAKVVGHDWGAMAAYTAANLAPERVEKLVTMAIPHPRAIRLTPGFFKKSWHFLTLSLPGAAAWVRRDHYAFIDRLVRRWSPGWHFTDADLEPVKRTLAAPGGIERALGYYRANLRTTVLSRFGAGKRQREVQQRKTAVPTLTIHGADDGAVDASQFARTSEAFTGPYRLVRIENAGHFVHREQPGRVEREVIEFLGDSR
jgi:pimeloyl-ACP methyl ester carboxylesterase